MSLASCESTLGVLRQQLQAGDYAAAKSLALELMRETLVTQAQDDNADGDLYLHWMLVNSATDIDEADVPTYNRIYDEAEAALAECNASRHQL